MFQRARIGRALAVGCLVAACVGSMWAHAPAQAGDLDSDGRHDLVISIPGDQSGSGTVWVLRGGEKSRTQIVSQAGGVPGVSERGDAFGGATVLGDFDGNGRDDLAIGAHGEDVNGRANAGAVTVMRGAAGGVTTFGAASWTQSSAGVPGASETGDRWGSGLASRDLDDDGFDDLVVGASGEDVGTAQDAGALTVLFGSASGLSATGSVQIARPSPGTAGAGLGRDRALAVADVNGDSSYDVVAGLPNEQTPAGALAGAVLIIPGGPTGPDTASSELVTKDSPGVPGTGAPGERFGLSVAAGTFNGDNFGDLAVGARHIAGAPVGSGALYILPGSAVGTPGPDAVELTEDTIGVPGEAAAGDGLGSSQSGTGDFDGDGYGDVAASIPGQGVSGHDDAGAVLVFYGSPIAIQVAGSHVLHANSPNVAGVAEPGDGLGAGGMVGLGLRSGAYDDLVVSVFAEDVASKTDAGAVVILRGSPAGLTGTGSVQLYEDGRLGRPTAGDNFGTTVS